MTKLLFEGYSYFDDTLKYLMLTGLFLHTLFLGYTLFVASLFIRRKRQLPRFYIGMLVLGMAILCLDLYAGQVYLDTPVDTDDIASIVRKAASLCIWIPYFLISVRVKRTFVK